MTTEPQELDPVAYLIAEFEVIALHLAREIDRLRARVRELESAAVPVASDPQAPR